MRISLPLRLFLVHLVFTVGAAAVAVLMVRDSFHRYGERWEREVAAMLPAELYRPLASEVGRSLLQAVEQEFPEVRERDRERIAAGLKTVLKGLPSIQALVVMDNDLRIQYASEPGVEGLAYRDEEDRAFFASERVRHRELKLASGRTVREVVVPVFDDPPEGGEARRRLGGVLVRYVPDANLAQRMTPRTAMSVPTRDFALPVILFLTAVAAGGVLVAILTGLPVHHLDRALAEFRARDFRGRLDAERLGLSGRLASAVKAINELGGRLEALDARGREREVLLEKLSQFLEQGMIALSPTGSPVAWNTAALRCLSIRESCDEHPDSRRRAEEAEIRNVLELNPDLLSVLSALGATDTMETELTGSTGARIAAQITMVPFEPRAGEEGTLLLIRDLATLRKIETHLMEAGRFAVLAHLAAGLAHEIRNPLHSIGLNATVVEEYAAGELTPQRRAAMRESLATVREETQRLAELLNSYLGLVRPGSEASVVDLHSVCRRVIQLLSYAARKSRVELRITGPERLPPICGVADRLQQAILNLVLNAIQAMPDGGEVRLHTSVAPGVVRLTVSDTGPGVPEDLADHLFDTRLTTKPGGAGLGLPLVRIIAEAHGGSVWYRSRPGEGSAFTLVLPAEPAA